jgi:signal transduction histidine kinase
MPHEELKRVFEQFNEIDNSNTKAKGGTGLGLAIAKQIVEMRGGRIWVDPIPGMDATFQMEVPVRAGCNHYVTKPYSPLQLLRIIQGLLGEKV